MFGHDDNNKNDQTTGMTNLPTPAVAGPVADGSLGSDDSTMASQVNDIVSNDAQSSAPVLGGSSITPASPSPSLVSPAPSATLSSGGIISNDDLLSIKQQALQHLSPLVSHLDQTPEEKFRTTMMMIQASDNQDLIKSAYEAAGQITDEKTRAQALLDIINEINYFTQQKQ